MPGSGSQMTARTEGKQPYISLALSAPMSRLEASASSRVFMLTLLVVVSKRIDRFVNRGETPLVGTKQSDFDMLDSLSMLLPWIGKFRTQS